MLRVPSTRSGEEATGLERAWGFYYDKMTVANKHITKVFVVVDAVTSPYYAALASAVVENRSNIGQC